MNTLPDIGSTVYGIRLHDAKPVVIEMRVISVLPNREGVVGAWFSARGNWEEDTALALWDEGISWTRSANLEAHGALLAASALFVSQ